MQIQLNVYIHVYRVKYLFKKKKHTNKQTNKIKINK